MQISSFVASIEAKVQPSVWTRSQGTAAAQLSQKTFLGSGHHWGPTKLGASGQRRCKREQKLTRPGSNLLKFPAGNLLGKGCWKCHLPFIRIKGVFLRSSRKGQRGGVCQISACLTNGMGP